MINRSLRAIILFCLFASFLGQVQASIVPQSCDESQISWVTASSGAIGDIAAENQDDCCDIDCCNANCLCSEGVCAISLYLASHTTHSGIKRLSDAVSEQLVSEPNSVITSLYRPPISTSVG